jgi:serine/threonine-protein kinase
MAASAEGRAPTGTPAKIGRYEVRGEIGRGMMGVVYEAFDPTLDRAVALKTVQLTFPVSHQDRESFELRFFAEARAAAALQHPNIVVIHDLGRDEETGILYMAQERLQGRNLADLTEGRALPWSEAVRIASRIAAALQAAHERGIVHRDVKPANVVLQPDGQPKVLDFGIARVPMSELTGAGQVFGTPSFMSPEQAWGEGVDPRSDVFSVGSVLYQLLTGRRPFEGDNVARVLRLVAESHPEPPSRVVRDVPERVDQVVARAMAKLPGARYATAGALSEDLADLCENRPPRHLTAATEGPSRAGLAAPGAATTAQPAPTLDLESELHALVSEPTHDVRPSRARAATARRLQHAALALGLLALLAAGFLAGRRSPERLPTPATAPTPTGAAPGIPGDGLPTPHAALPTPIPLTPATIRVDFEHHLKSGNLRIWIDGEVALDRWLSPDSEKSIIGIKFRHGELTDSLDVAPGTHDVRVRLAWDDNQRTETVTAHLTEGESRVLRIRIDRLTRRLSLDWH